MDANARLGRGHAGLIAAATLFFAGCLAAAPPKQSVPPASPRLKVLVDADTANEVDDLFAIVRVFHARGVDVVALTSAQYVTQRGAPPDSALHSHRLNQRLLAALGRNDVPAAPGADQPLVDRHTPRDSAAARLIIEHARAASPTGPLVILTLGAVTNVASAILMAPDIVPRIQLWSIALKYEAAGWDRQEFNADNDQLALDALLATPGLDLTLMTATASKGLIFSRAECGEKLASRGALGRFVLDYWDQYVRVMPWDSRLWAEHRSWRMWDVALVETLLDPKLGERRRIEPPRLLDGTVLGRKVAVFTAIDAAAMAERYWRSLTAGTPKGR